MGSAAKIDHDGRLTGGEEVKQRLIGLPVVLIEKKKARYMRVCRPVFCRGHNLPTGRKECKVRRIAVNTERILDGRKVEAAPKRRNHRSNQAFQGSCE